MPAFPIVNATMTLVCTCPKRKCVRRGQCGLCRAYHLNRKRPRPPRCERKPGWLARLFGA